MKLAFGSASNTLGVKDTLLNYAKELGHEVADFGDTDPVVAHTATKLAEAVAAGEYDRGILVCGNGMGVSISANKVKGAYCAAIHDCFQAVTAATRNNANIIAIGAQAVGIEVAKQMVKEYLESAYVPNDDFDAKFQGIVEYENEHMK